MLTPEAKKLLAETIRGSQQDPEKGLRAKLLRAIHDEADRRYRLSVAINDAGLDEAHRRRRERIEAWIDERARAAKPKTKTELKATQERLLAQAEKEAAATLINRLVLIRHLEALGLSKPAVLTGGWSSRGYREFREFAPTLCTNGTTDATEGYATLLQLLFNELATDLPGLFGDVGLTRLFPVPAATLREVVERLDQPDLASAWTDDTTLGWVYQYWNDPDREVLDAKINSGGKIEPHEIASKTQMFTERYMVEWLLQNSLGLTWLCMCKKRGWTADAEQVLPVLEARRVEWRTKRDAAEVALDALMPIEGELEDHWKYYVPQALPDDAVQKSPESVRAIKLLDPACGSGHFLVVAFGLLTALYREEARHRGQSIGDREIAESILENNLHGIDIDPRAIQIAAAGLYLKAKSLAKGARPKHVNLVAPVLQLGSLPSDDPAVVHLREDLTRDAGIPEELTNKLLSSLAGVDHLGSLLKVDAAVEGALRSVELEFERVRGQGDLFGSFPAQQVKLSIGEVKATVLDRLEHFLAKHSKSEDLGLRLDGEQLAAGVRFARIAKDAAYDVVVANPPYQGLLKTVLFDYVSNAYPLGRADLYGAFLERAIQFARVGGVSALLTMRGWLFLGQFQELREHMLGVSHLSTLADFDFGAFDEISAAQVVVSVAGSVFVNSAPLSHSVGLRPTPVSDRVSAGMTSRKRSGLLAQSGHCTFNPSAFAQIPGNPIVYWWSSDFLARYAELPKLGDVGAVRLGMSTSNNSRYTRRPWEVQVDIVVRCGDDTPVGPLLDRASWVPTIMGSKGIGWFEPLRDAVRWRYHGLEMKVDQEIKYGSASRRIQSQDKYFSPGVAFTMLGNAFRARLHRFRSIFGDKGSSVFLADRVGAVCAMNRTFASRVVEDLTSTVSFTVGDVAALPIADVAEADRIVAVLESAFTQHERARETSVEFSMPGPSPWRRVQGWAHAAVDRVEGEPLPTYEPEYDPPAVEDFLSFAFGIALGRFKASGEGSVERAAASALPGGVVFVAAEGSDSLQDASCKHLHDEWKIHGSAVAQAGRSNDLSTYLRKSFFTEHKQRYENRPIYFPLSSTRKSFVAFISIHRWQDDTLNVLLADHLVPTRRRLEGELEDLRAARVSGNNKGKAEKRLTEVQNLLKELNDFIAKVTEVAEKGPPPADDKTPNREVDDRYVMDLDDGVMVNSAALWPLLEPQWKDPKKWWKELASAQGKKDYDWSHLAARYFPTRVKKKCHEDPSLAVAHKCFWELRPAKAYAWELRLQDEIRHDFTIDEPGSDEARTKFLAEHAAQAKEIVAAEMKRRERKVAKGEKESEDGPLFEQGDEDAQETGDD